VFELVINGMEFAPGYTELTDPIIQRERLLAQAGEKRRRWMKSSCSPWSMACLPRAVSDWGSTGW
jgi:elongation factor P--beta-lysine ligase